MTPITATELDLLTFFEAEPHRADADEPWLLNDMAYEYSAGRNRLSFAVAPSYKDVRIVLRDDERVLYELNAMAVDDIEYLSDGGGRNESLRITLSARDTLTIRLKPAIAITQVLTSNA